MTDSDEVVERVARHVEGAYQGAPVDGPISDDARLLARTALAALRPGDVLPGGKSMVVEVEGLRRLLIAVESAGTAIAENNIGEAWECLRPVNDICEQHS